MAGNDDIMSTCTNSHWSSHLFLIPGNFFCVENISDIYFDELVDLALKNLF